jgi:hypothetical protein
VIENRPPHHWTTALALAIANRASLPNVDADHSGRRGLLRTAPPRAPKSTTVRADSRGAHVVFNKPLGPGGSERETRLELATRTLARYVSNSVFGGGQKCPLNEYLPPISTGIHADHTAIHGDRTGVHAGHKRRPQAGEGVRGTGACRSIAGSRPSCAGVGAWGEDAGLRLHALPLGARQSQ